MNEGAEKSSWPKKAAAAGLWLVLGAAVVVFTAGPRDVGGPRLLEFHPWVLPWRDDVTMAPGAWMHAASQYAQLLGILGVAATLRPRLWLATIAAYIALSCPAWGAFVPHAPRYGLILLAATLRWRDHDALAGMALATAALLDSLFGSTAILAYGMSQANLMGLALVDGAVFVVVAVALLRAGGSWLVALPALAIAADLVLLGASAEAMEDHHELPPAPGECDDLDVRLLHPLEDGGPPFLPRGVAQGPGAIAVSGQGGVGVLEPDGRLDRRLPQAEDWGRVEFVAWQGEELLAAAGGATIRWAKRGEAWSLVSADSWSDAFPEILHVSAAGGQTVWTTGNYPLIMREPQRDMVYMGGGHQGFVAFAHHLGDALVLADAWTITAYDPSTLRPLRSRAFAPWSFATRVNAGPARLFRMVASLRRVEVVDPVSLVTDFTFDVPYAPRYMAASADGSRLLLADYFGDRLELRDGADGALLSEHRGGRRPRNITWSEARGAFLGVSACGAYELVPPR